MAKPNDGRPSPEEQAYWDEEARIDSWLEGGAPSFVELWEAERARRAGRKIKEQPLSVKEAAERENVSPKTIYRRLDQLAVLDPPGAWKIGQKWLIRPEALDLLREHPSADAKPAAKTRSKRRKSAPKASADRWEL